MQCQHSYCCSILLLMSGPSGMSCYESQQLASELKAVYQNHTPNYVSNDSARSCGSLMAGLAHMDDDLVTQAPIHVQSDPGLVVLPARRKPP